MPHREIEKEGEEEGMMGMGMGIESRARDHARFRGRNGTDYAQASKRADEQAIHSLHD